MTQQKRTPRTDLVAYQRPAKRTELVEYRRSKPDPAASGERDDFDGMGRKIRGGVIAIVLVFGGLGAWMAMASLEGAIVAPGQVQVETSRKAVQHLEGGIVKEILVRDGDQVKQNDLLVRLTDKAVGANLRLVQGQIAELAVRRARLIAEREGREEIAIPRDVQTAKGDAGLAAIVEGQRNLLAARRESTRNEIRLLRQQQDQLRAQIKSMKDQDASKTRQIESLEEELKGVRAQAAKGTAPKGQQVTLERAAETNRGELAALAGGIAAAEMKINELELQILRLDTTAQEKVAEELRSVEAEINAVSERLVISQDQVERTEIRSPRNGRVYKLAVHAPGAVVKAGDVLMEIVPEDDTLVVAAQVNPRDVDKIQTGQTARVRLSAFNQRTTPELNGLVSVISPDMITDPATGRAFYQATISIPPDQMQRLAGLTLKPGMPAETMISTGDRSPLSYLLKPVTDSFARALRED